MQNEASRRNFAKEIYELTNKSRDLQILFHQETGKSYIRAHKKQLRRAGVTSGWFGIFHDVMIASAKTEKELERIINELVVENRRDLIVRFQMKEK